MKGVHRVVAKGRTYWYAERGGPRLPGEPGSREFLEALIAFRQRPEESRTIRRLVVDYKASDDFARLSETTKKTYTPWFDRISDGLGRLSIKSFNDPRIRKVIKKWRSEWKDTPRQADTGKQVLSVILSYAVENGSLMTNPCFGISNLYEADRSGLIWLPEDIDLFAKHSSKEFMFALRLATLTGLRKSDLLRLEWRHVGEKSIDLPTGKSKGRLSYEVPLYGELRDLLAEIKAHWSGRKVRPLTVLGGERGHAWTPNGFGTAWQRARVAVETAGDIEWHLTFHDARGTAATKYAGLGFSDEEIAEMVGWEKTEVTKIVDRYVRKGARLKAKIERLGG
jgi:integrase